MLYNICLDQISFCIKCNSAMFTALINKNNFINPYSYVIYVYSIFYV